MIITSNTLTGYTYTTVFKFSLSSTETVRRSVWETGAGEVYEDVDSIQHTYNLPGVYIVKCKVITDSCTVVTHTQSIEVAPSARDSIQFTRVPYIYREISTPTDVFTVCVTSTQVDRPIVLDINSINSKSIPHYVVNDRWEFLAPQWRFVTPYKNKSTNEYDVLNDFTVKAVELTARNTDGATVTYAITGEYSFRYIDDLSNKLPQETPPLILTVSMQTSGLTTQRDSLIYPYESFSNSNITTAVVWQLNAVLPDSIKISSNHLEPIHHLKWKNIKIPFLAAAQLMRTNTTTTTTPSIAFNYPTETYSVSTTFVMLTSQDDITYNITENTFDIPADTSEFVLKDKQDILTSGYVYSTLTSFITCNYAKISACSVAVDSDITSSTQNNNFIYPNSIVPQPNIWVCNPLERTVTRAQLAVIPYEYSNIVELQIPNLVLGTSTNFSTSATKEYTSFNYQITGESGTGAIAVDVSNTNYAHSVIVLDSLHDFIYRFATIIDTDGNETPLIKVRSFKDFSQQLNLDLTKQSITPASVSIDSQNNIWVALYDKYDVIKLDEDFNFITKVDTNTKMSIQDGDFILKPVLVETDRLDNVWVIYEQPSGSCVTKYSKTGSKICELVLPNSIRPSGIVVDIFNNIWVLGCTLSESPDNNITGYNNSVLMYISSSGELLLTKKIECKNAEHLSIDKQGNIWFLYSLRGVGYYSTSENYVRLWSLTDDHALITRSTTLLEQTGEINSELGGMSIDIFDRLWIIDSKFNRAVCIHSYSQLLSSDVLAKTTFKILPDNNISHYITSQNTIGSIYNTDNRSARSYGDITGTRWLQKYTSTSDTIQLTGISNSFSIKNLNDNEFNIRIKNENFNMGGYLGSLALPDYMQEFTNFYDQIFTASVGDNTYIHDNVGVKTYERIANFIDNTADIDTCNIQQLISNAKMVGVDEILALKSDIPNDITRLLDICSISQRTLWGTTSASSSNSLLDTELMVQLSASSVITAGEQLRLRDIRTGKITMLSAPLSSFYVPNIGAIYSDTYLLGDMITYEYNTVGKVLDSFDVFRITDSLSSIVYCNSVIDWYNPFNTLLYSLSSDNDWYGEEGTLESMFNMILTRYLSSTS